MSTRFAVNLESGNSFSRGLYKVAKGRPLILTAGDPMLAYFQNNRRFLVTELPGPKPGGLTPEPVVEPEPEPEPVVDVPEPEEELDEEPEADDDEPEWTPYQLREMKRAELAKLASELGFDVRSSDRKADLITAIESTRE